ncbi:hypothetical protein KKG38_00405 [Patescibacteria group bacterium]|nr:hypothetical protein [Patescibacteria group bacterium]
MGARRIPAPFTVPADIWEQYIECLPYKSAPLKIKNTKMAGEGSKENKLRIHLRAQQVEIVKTFRHVLDDAWSYPEIKYPSEECRNVIILLRTNAKLTAYIAENLESKVTSDPRKIPPLPLTLLSPKQWEVYISCLPQIKQ